MQFVRKHGTEKCSKINLCICSSVYKFNIDELLLKLLAKRGSLTYFPAFHSFPVAQLVEHGVSNAKIMGSIARESKS